MSKQTKRNTVTTEALTAAAKAVDNARKTSQVLIDRYTKETLMPRMRKHIGRCFQYRNTYGSGKAWWLYAKIVGVKDSEYEFVTIQKTSLGMIEISTQLQSFHWDAANVTDDRPLGASYLPIRRSLFKLAARRILAGAAKAVRS